MYDIIIIGAGTAGITAYKEAIKHTQNILIINDGPWDTTCARVGCMPSKVLIAAANRMHEVQTASKVGLHIDAMIDTSNVMQHVRSLRDRFTLATLKDVNSWDESHKITGKAHFINHNTIQVNDRQYQSKSFILAVGSQPTINKDWKKDIGEHLLTSDQVFEIPTLPKSLAVVGSGVIAIELAQAMHRLGVETTVFARSRKVGSLSSPNLQALAVDVLSQELKIKFEVLPEKVNLENDKVKVTFKELKELKELKEIEVDYILNATGRKSLLSTLQLENIEPAFKDSDHLPFDAKTNQLADYPIFVAGDAYTDSPIQHEAAHAGRKAVENCLNYPSSNPVKTLVPLGIMFCSPEMAGLGQTYKTLTEHGIDFVVGKVSYAKQGRAIVNGKNVGAAEVYVDRTTRKLLGAELFVDHAEHLAHLLAWQVAHDLTVDQILEQPFYHPTLEEGIRTALKHAKRQLD